MATFNLAIIGLLVALCFKPKFTLLNEWAYFVLQIFPTIIGTITAATLEAIITALSRITPFMRCASPIGALAKTSIMLPYVPLLGLGASWRSRHSENWHLLVANVILWLGYPVLGLKAALLSASIDTGMAEASNWAVYALLCAYFIITIFIVGIAVYLHGRTTGLRHGWDTVNIADHLVLFRHSNFLDTFEGSCIATRESMLEKLGNMRLKLGYWERDGEHWYGFNEITNSGRCTFNSGLAKTNRRGADNSPSGESGRSIL